LQSAGADARIGMQHRLCASGFSEAKGRRLAPDAWRRDLLFGAAIGIV